MIARGNLAWEHLLGAIQILNRTAQVLVHIIFRARRPCSRVEDHSPKRKLNSRANSENTPPSRYAKNGSVSVRFWVFGCFGYTCTDARGDLVASYGHKSSKLFGLAQ